MKKVTLIFLLICAICQLKAQDQTTTISGRIIDEATNIGIELVGIRILNAKDSAYVSGTTTDADGKFRIRVKPARYIVQVSYIGYATVNKEANAFRNVVLGDIYMREDGVLLGEAVVTAVAPEIVVKGDTVEYNADSYRVQEGAVLEDLIKKIPGAEIDSDGKIKVNGKDISKILGDGKEFFSDDPKTASQNLPAKMVEKLQVLDKKSDMAQLTGFDDGEEETVINLVVKPEMKQGLMSNTLAGYGNKERYEGNGFINYAKNDTRVTLLGNINNTNNANANVRGPGRAGLLTTKEAGMNIAGESSKLKYDADVSFSYTDNNVESTSNTQYIGIEKSDFSFSKSDTKNTNFRIRNRMEWTVDSLTTVIFRPNINYSQNDRFSIGNSSRTDAVTPNNNTEISSHSASNGKTWNFNGNLLLNRKLNDKGRSVTLELSGGSSNGRTDGDNFSLNDFVNQNDTTLLDQIYNQKNNSSNWRVRASYLEPVWRSADNTKMNLLELAYSIRGTHSETDKKTYDYSDVTDDYTTVADDYTRRTENDFINQNVTLSFQARRQKYNYTLGAGLEPSSTKTSTFQPNQEDKVMPRRNYMNFAPRAEFNYLWDRRHSLRLRYEGRTSQASTDQLFDGVISQNATDTTRGNPNLSPSFSHNFNMRYQKFNAERASSIMAFANLSYITNDITSITTWGANSSRNTTYKNIDGNIRSFFRLSYNTPLRNRKFSFNTGTSGRYNRDNTYISSRESDPQENRANVFSIGEDVRLKFNSDLIQFNIGANITYESTRYTLQKEKNADVYNYGGFGNFTLYLPYNFTIESDLNYSSNSGYEGGFEQNTWLWNASVAKQVLKNQGTVRFKIYDILQERSSITRTSNADNITFTTSNTINSYFMVNFIYRFTSFKGMKASDMEQQQRGPGGDRRPPRRMM